MRSRAAVIVAGVVAGLVAGLGVVVFGAASPASAATCGSRCDGKNPQYFVVAHEGPSPGRPQYCHTDAVTPRGYKVNGLELRYSAYCRTAWARLQNPDAAVGPGWRWYTKIESFRADGTLRKSYEGETWTEMVNDAGLKARACLYTSPGGESEYTKAFCTDKY